MELLFVKIIGNIVIAILAYITVTVCINVCRKVKKYKDKIVGKYEVDDINNKLNNNKTTQND